MKTAITTLENRLVEISEEFVRVSDVKNDTNCQEFEIDRKRDLSRISSKMKDTQKALIILKREF